MYKQFKSYLNTSIGIAILGLIFGTILLIYPNTSLNLISNIISVTLIVSGVLGIIRSSQTQVIVNSFNGTGSVILLVFGIVLFLNEKIIESIIPIVLGIAFISSGINKMRYSFILKKMNDNWIGSFIASLIATISGILMLTRPIATSILITTFIGALIIVYSISSIIDIIILKKNAKDFNDYFDKFLK